MSAGFVLLTLAAAGCRREDIQVYRVPKEAVEAPRAMAAAPSAPASSGQAKAPIRWEVPTGWQDKPASAMRVGSFSATGSDGGSADISVIPIQGDSGTEIDNINRWRGQVGLDAVTADEAAKLGETVSISGHDTKLFDFAGTPKGKAKAERILVASLPHDGAMWFFKMSGDDATVKAEKPRFVAFLNSMRYTSDGAPAPAVTQAAPAPAKAEPAAAPAKEGGWKIPAAWTEVPPGAMQQAKFTASGDGGAKAEVTISIFPNQAGSALMNVNRWRGQIQLAPITEGELPKLTETIDAPSGKITFFDMKNDTNGKRVVSAVLNRSGETWYVKLMGDAVVVGRERAAFLNFVRDPK